MKRVLTWGAASRLGLLQRGRSTHTERAGLE